MLSDTYRKLKEIIDRELESIMDAEHPMFSEALKEYIMRGGKRIRPILMILSARAFAKDREQAFMKASLSIELFHNFTLIHDDIEDGSPFRRGKPTLHMVYGIPIAINLGDALYTIVWEKLISSGLTNKELKAVASTFKEVVSGQQIELTAIHEESFDLDYEEYYNLAGNKTGSLIALCLALPSLETSEEKFKRLYSATRMLGVAFQIRDDLLNLTGDFEKYKKKIGDDITEGKRTLMVLYALKNLPEQEAARLKTILKSHTEREEDIKEAIELIKKSGAVDFASEIAEQLVQENLPVLDELFPEGEEKKELMAIIRMFIERES